MRAVAACQVPIISAVGHEIDFTLSDFAADVRAETPSAAAELISSHFVEALERVERAGENLSSHLLGRLESARSQLTHAGSRLRLLSPSTLVEQGYLRLDDCANRLASALRAGVKDRRHQMAAIRSELVRLSPEVRVQNESQRLLALWKRLQSVSPTSVLKRGFIIMNTEEGTPVTRVEEVSPGALVTAEFYDGRRRFEAK